MKQHIVILDGYNVIHKAPELRARLNESLLSAREALIQRCAAWCRERGDVSRFCVVFDGDASVPEEGVRPAPGVQVIYSRNRETADERIRDLLREERPDCTFTVVSNDRYVMTQAREAKAAVWSVEEFCATLFRIRRSGDQTGGPEASGSGKAGLTPAEEKSITDSLRRQWGG